MITLEQTNTFLTSLINNSTIAWQQGIYDAYGDSPKLRETARKSIRSYLAYFSTNPPMQDYHVRFHPGSIKNIVALHTPGLTPSIGFEILDVLKTTKRVLQVGGGKGRGLLVANLIPLTQDEFPSQEELNVDVSDLLKQLNKVVSRTDKDVEILQEQIVELKKVIEEKENTIVNLNNILANQTRHSWS